MFVETVSGWNVTSENISKKTTNFFLVPGLRSQHFGHLLQKPKPQLTASLPSNHSLDLYLPKSLGPYKGVCGTAPATPVLLIIHKLENCDRYYKGQIFRRLWSWQNLKNLYKNWKRTKEPKTELKRTKKNLQELNGNCGAFPKPSGKTIFINNLVTRLPKNQLTDIIKVPDILIWS